MPITVTMPRLSDTMEQGTVVKWHVKKGDAVEQGQVIADIETDKATMELESFDTGTVAKIAADEGAKVAVGSTIMIIAEEGESAEEAASSGAAPDESDKPAAEAGGKSGEKTESKNESGSDKAETGSDASPTATAEQDRSSDGASDRSSASGDEEETGAGANGARIFASPLARKIAAERGIDLSGIKGTGPGGRVTRKDVESGGEPAEKGGGTRQRGAPTATPVSAPEAELEDKTVPLSGMRETIAKRLVESKTTIPHYQVTVSARLDALLELREQLNDQLEPQGVKLSVNDFLVRACAVAMHQHPFVNSSWEAKGPSIRLHGRVNIGVAIALPTERGGGLVVATLRDADRTGLRQISSETRRLAKKAREKGLTVEEMSDSTFTISNMGMFDVDHFTAIINPPNAAILAVGRAIEKPFIEYDEDGDAVLTVGHEMSMTISCDHRVIDGAMAAHYLGTVRELLENPATLLV